MVPILQLQQAYGSVNVWRTICFRTMSGLVGGTLVRVSKCICPFVSLQVKQQVHMLMCGTIPTVSFDEVCIFCLSFLCKVPI